MSLAYETMALPPPDAWLRTLVAECLAVDEAALAPAVSLRDDLAADSLDLADVAAALEHDIGIAVPSSLLARVRTYGDLLALAEMLVSEQARRAREATALVRTRLSSPRAPAALERIFQLDPYAIEILLEDAAEAAAGTRLDVLVHPSTPAPVIARVRTRLAPLARRGVMVDVRRAGLDGSAAAPGVSATG